MPAASRGLGQIQMIRGNGDAAIAAFEGELQVHRKLSGIPELIRALK